MGLEGCAANQVVSFDLSGSHGISELVVALVLLDTAREFGDLVVNRSPLFHELADLFVGVHDRGVVAIAEELANLREREARHLPAEVHGDLSCGGDRL